MPYTLVLSHSEIVELTNAVYFKKQCSVLSQMGIPFTPRPDGSPAVLKTALQTEKLTTTRSTDFTVITD